MLNNDNANTWSCPDRPGSHPATINTFNQTHPLLPSTHVHGCMISPVNSLMHITFIVSLLYYTLFTRCVQAKVQLSKNILYILWHPINRNEAKIQSAKICTGII